MKERFLRLLYATHNVGGNAQPETKEGQRFSQAAIDAIESLAEIAEDGPHDLDGALAAAKLFVEVYSSDNPKAYIEQEIRRGLSGERHEFDGVEPSKAEKRAVLTSIAENRDGYFDFGTKDGRELKSLVSDMLGKLGK